MNSERENLKRTFSTDGAAYDQLRPDYPEELATHVLTDASAAFPSVIEVGCGTGIATGLFLPHASRLVAIDPSADMIAVATKRFGDVGKVTFSCVSFENAELESASFDLLLSAQSFHWVDLKVAFPKVKRVLRRRGRVALFWNYFDFEANPLCVEIRDRILEAVPSFSELPDASRANLAAYREHWVATLEGAKIFMPPVARSMARRMARDGAWFRGWLGTLSWYKVLDEATRRVLLNKLEPVLRELCTLDIVTLLIVADLAE